MKRTYVNPTMVVVKLQHHSIICSSYVSRVTGTEDFTYGGGGSGESYTRESSSVWDSEW